MATRRESGPGAPNQMLQATPVCAFLFFLARSPGALELDVRHERATLRLLNRRQRREQRLDRSEQDAEPNDCGRFSAIDGCISMSLYKKGQCCFPGSVLEGVTRQVMQGLDVRKNRCCPTDG